MTTATTNTPISHADDAGFRAWGSELSGMLATVGLVQTADTGQINWTTVTKPGTISTAAGYEIWRFADTLQSTAPVFLKVEYGNSGTTIPGAWVTVGTGSDGAGSLTGATIARAQINPATTSFTAGTYPSYACHDEGFFGLVFKAGGGPSGTPVFGVFVSRPLDDTGTVSSDGACLVVPGAGSGSKASGASVAFATSVRFPTSGMSSDMAMVPMAVSASVVGTDFQVIRNVAPFPRFRTLVGMFSYLRAEVVQGATIDVALEGVTARTYMTLGTYAPYATNQATDGYSHAMLWQ